MISLTILIPLGVILLLGLIILFKSFVNVRGDQIAVLERKYMGNKIPDGRVLAFQNEVGIQARILGPGLRFIFPFIYKVTKYSLTKIPIGQIGIVESIDGTPLPIGQIFARSIEGHSSYQDGEAFLKQGGQKGPQIEILPPGNYRINPLQFRVKPIQSTIINPGQLGVVTAADGLALEPGRLLGKIVKGHNSFQDIEAFLANGGQKGPQSGVILPGEYRINTDFFNVKTVDATFIQAEQVGTVTAKDGAPLGTNEFIAKSINGHDNFQDIEEFLLNGGERGPQIDTLTPGTYYINPLMFKVDVEPVGIVERGQVAVIISNIGSEPKEIKNIKAQLETLSTDPEKNKVEITALEDRLKNGIERYVVDAGERGIQREVAGPGKYYLNRKAYMVSIIDTTNITVDWDSEEKTKFDPLKVVSKDGFEISVSVKVIFRVKPEQAPYMMAKIGSIENLVNHVIHPMIDSSFRNQASSTEAMNFLEDRHVEQDKAETRARTELDKYHVELVSVLICQIILPSELMDIQTSKVKAEQKKSMYDTIQESELKRIESNKTTARADKQSELVKAEIDVSIAEQNKKTAVFNAEGQAAAIKEIGNAEASKIEAIGAATASAYEKQKTAIGPQGIIAIEVAKQIAEGKIKVTPDIMITGSNAESGLLNGVLSQFLKDTHVS